MVAIPATTDGVDTRVNHVDKPERPDVVLVHLFLEQTVAHADIASQFRRVLAYAVVDNVLPRLGIPDGIEVYHFVAKAVTRLYREDPQRLVVVVRRLDVVQRRVPTHGGAVCDASVLEHATHNMIALTCLKLWGGKEAGSANKC